MKSVNKDGVRFVLGVRGPGPPHVLHGAGCMDSHSLLEEGERGVGGGEAKVTVE